MRSDSQCSRSQEFISYYPLKQGLKPKGGMSYLRNYSIYILLSIKTRIETLRNRGPEHITFSIYILLSIKTRIETVFVVLFFGFFIQFISYYPLKQGLKH